LQIGLELWIHFGTRQQLELERVLKIFCNHFHGPPPLANVSTGYKLTGKQAKEPDENAPGERSRRVEN
jgi:hypothetical protein